MLSALVLVACCYSSKIESKLLKKVKVADDNVWLLCSFCEDSTACIDSGYKCSGSCSGDWDKTTVTYDGKDYKDICLRLTNKDECEAEFGQKDCDECELDGDLKDMNLSDIKAKCVDGLSVGAIVGIVIACVVVVGVCVGLAVYFLVIRKSKASGAVIDFSAGN